MPTVAIFKLLQISLLCLLVQFGVASSARAQNTITLHGRVMYSTGQPASGATVTMTKTFYDVSPAVTSVETTATDSGGNYSFESQGRCAVSYSLQAVSTEIVDDEPLPPSGSGGPSGCVLSNFAFDLEIFRPAPITLGGYVTDELTGRPVQGITVTMTRTKYDFEPDVVTTATTTTNGSGYFQFSTFSRCSVVADFRPSLGSYTFPSWISPSGCVITSNTNLPLTVNFNKLMNAGASPCNASVGAPVNVTNGNMYLQQTDYQLPGAGEAIAISRTYNSISQNIGLFGRGWSTKYDETMTTLPDNLLQLTLPDGRVLTSLSPDFYGQMTRNGDGSYTVTFKDGRVHQFNTSGKLLSLTDRHGNVTLLTYANGTLSSITDPFARVLTVTTNSSGRVLTLSDPLGTIATYTYGGSNELLSTTYPDNSGYAYSYTGIPGGLGLTTVTDALGNIVEQHDYDPQGRATSSQAHGGVNRYTLSYISLTETDVTDALGHVTKYIHSNIKGRSVVTRVEGLCNCGGSSQVQNWTHDNQANVTAKTDALNHTQTFTYDAAGNRLTVTDATGTVAYTYNQFGELLTRTDQMNGVTTNTFDSSGNRLMISDALNQTTAFTYDSRGQLLTMTNALGKVTRLTWDANGRLVQTKDALNNTTDFAYDARARLTSATNALNFATSYAYDAAGRVNKITRPDNSFISFTYDLAGRRTRVTDALNNSTSFSYDPASRLIRVTDAAQKATSYNYDSMSNLTDMTDALAQTTSYEYDDFNRLVKLIYPPAVSGGTRLQETITYDAAGNVTSRTDTANRITSLKYDNANRLTTVTDPAMQITRYEYDARSNVTALVDAINQRYTFDYDALSRVITATRAGVQMSYAYDAAGNPSQRTDYNNMATSYTYDALNRLTKITYPDASTATYGYDKLSQLTSAANMNGTVSFTYDNLGRATGTTDVFGQVLNYAYDANDRRTRLSFGAITNATYTYDALNRLTQITDGAKDSVSYVYDATGKLISQTLPNDITTTYNYDGLGRLTRLKDAKRNKVIADNQYSYNNAGDITENTDLDGTHTYSYDQLDRLTSATHTGTPAESYAYDGVGNRTASHRSAVYSYQPFDRLIGAGTATYIYNNNGNMTSKSDASGTTQLVWDFENRLTQVVTPASGSVTYKYDALGRRIQRTPSSGVSTNFIYDGQEVVRDINSDGSTAEYLNGPGIDNKIRQKGSSSSSTYYFSQDHLGSTTALTGANGKLIEQIAYDAYGNSGGSPRTRYDYTGRERDQLTGLLYYRARFYDPQLGRFISEDPIGLAGGINSFAYVGNNPQNAKDPSGLYEIDVHYYLTYFLALKTGCFTDAEAREIANGDQGVDENPASSPDLGDTERQQQVNAFYHGLHPGSHAAYLDAHWMIATQGNRGNLAGLGIFLHYRQDMFSHAGYTNPKWGHATGFHAVDKTDEDVAKALRMAQATWDALNKFASERKCGCRGTIDPSWWKQIEDFAKASGGGPYDRRRHSIDEINPWFLNNKISILQVPHR